MRILSTFPRLGNLEAITGQKLTGQQDSENDWLKNFTQRLCELCRTKSPYERHIRDICAPDHCIKLAVVLGLIKGWESNEKAVFCTMGPTNALILYGVDVIR